MKFVKKNFDESNNTFFVLKNKASSTNYYYEEYTNVKYYTNILQFIARNYFEIFKAKKIIVHQLNIPLIMLFWLVFYPIVFKKLVWVIWGGDLYGFYEQRTHLKEKLIEFVRNIFIRKIRYIASYIKGDFELSKIIYHTNAKYYKVAYPYTINENVLSIENKEKDESLPLNILVGNSADPSNNHIEILNQLSKFKLDNIRLYIPLSYGGDKKYINDIISHANSIFGDKVEFLTGFLKFDDYIKQMNQMDICIFNHNRQQGLGNLILMICLRKKMYIPATTTPYKFYIDSGIDIFDTHSISKLSFNEFKDTSMIDFEKNRNKLFTDLDERNLVKEWSVLLNHDLA